MIRVGMQNRTVYNAPVIDCDNRGSCYWIALAFFSQNSESVVCISWTIHVVDETEGLETSDKFNSVMGVAKRSNMQSSARHHQLM